MLMVQVMVLLTITLNSGERIKDASPNFHCGMMLNLFGLYGDFKKWRQ